MEEQVQNQRPAAEDGNGKHHNRPRRHRHHRHSGNPRPAEGEARAEVTAGEQEPRQPKQPQARPARNEHKPNEEAGNSNAKGKDHSGKGQHSGNKKPNQRQNQRNGGEGKKHREHNNGSHTRRGLEDLYGAPTEADVMTMDELRAKIVLQAADGSVPAAEAPAPSSTLPAAPAPQTEEAAEEAAVADTDWLYGSAAEAPAVEEIPPEERVEVVGIRFRSAGKVYFFDPKGIELHRGDSAIVETARGAEFGEVSFGNRMVRKQDTVSPLRPVLRAATQEDIAHNEENRAKEKDALYICQEKILQHKLEMKLIDVQYAFDNSKLLFYFTSDGRVDFRDLVKDLASVFRTRIELRQIGIRDEAKMLGGLGACGRPLCCASFLPDFVQVSIKMAKEQNLSLNSAKISGVCGRLMCCLRYEADVYAEEIRRTPPHGSFVKTEEGVGTVVGSNPLAGTVKVALKNTPDAPPKQFSRDAVTVLSRKEHEDKDQNN